MSINRERFCEQVTMEQLKGIQHTQCPECDCNVFWKDTGACVICMTQVIEPAPRPKVSLKLSELTW